MIKNVVFDIGNVLLDFKPKDYLKSFAYDDEVQTILFNCIFNSPHWLELDRGTIDEEEAIRLFCTEAPDYSFHIKEVMKGWPDLFSPMQETVELLRELKEKGYKVYILSNFHEKSFQRVFLENPFFKMTDGKVISYEIHSLKPEREIYEHLLGKYALKAEETVFIDDMDANIKGAASLGMKGVLFDNISRVKKELEELKVL